MRSTSRRAVTRAWLVIALSAATACAADPAPLPGTRPLSAEGDLASAMVDGIDRFLLRKTEESRAGRARFWHRDIASMDAYHLSIQPNRKRLAEILGVRDARNNPDAPILVAGVFEEIGSPFPAGTKSFVVQPHLWPAFGDVHGEGLLLRPMAVEGASVEPLGTVVVVPDADQTPEQLAGLVGGLPTESQVARRLAESGFEVIVPTLIDRAVAPRHGGVPLSRREFVYRPAFELGRHPIGYDVQKVLALVDLHERMTRRKGQRSRFGVFGYGDGGAVALYAAALDPRIDVLGVSGYVDDRRDTWQQPVDRNLFRLLEQFGDAEVLSLVAPRPSIIEAARGPEVVIPNGTGAAPGRLRSPSLETVRTEVERAQSFINGLMPAPRIKLVVSGPDGQGPFGSDAALGAFMDALAPGTTLAKPGPRPEPLNRIRPPREAADLFQAHAELRQARQLHELDRHGQELLAESPETRARFFKNLDTSSPEHFRRTIEPYRTRFRDEVIGRFEDPKLAPDVRSRKVFDTPAFTGYEVVMDVFPDVFASGILLVPKGIPEGERRPVVVCQHGLEGRPRDVADPSINNPAYHQFAVKLAERGFVTFAPQNLYLFGDRFRSLQRKANPIGKTLFSIIVPQHQQITDWLKTLPFVEPTRIGFYGLSYGGKTAMRVPPLVENYCLSICSADFNEWVWKNASTRSRYSYVWSPEYEIFEWDLGSTFNYAEMAALIAPRPFMVERGHFDGVAPDEAIGYEFAKVRFLYEAKLGAGDDCAIEWFTGPHTIHGVGTFAFLHKHLNWPAP